MPAGLIDHVFDLFPLVCHDQQGLLLIIAVEQVQGLGGCILENDRIKGLVPSEEIAGGQQDDCIKAQDQVEAVDAPLAGKINGYEIRSSGRGIYPQTEGHDHAVDQSSENTDQKSVVSERMGGDQVCQKTCEQDHFTGKKRKFGADISEPDIDRKCVQGDIDEGIGQFNTEVLESYPLKEDGQAGRASGIEAPCPDKGLYVERHQD